MNFSDWITVVSILIAVLLVVIKMNEWRVINMKKPLIYVLVTLIFLLTSGVASYFETHSPPNWIEYVFFMGGISPGLWSIIWMFVFFVSVYFAFKKFIYKPIGYNDALLNYYLSLIKKPDTELFEHIFFKYENAFFKKPSSWKGYRELMEVTNFWELLTVEQYDYIKQNREHLRELDRTAYVHEALLRSQIRGFPDSLLSKELQMKYNQDPLMENDKTPILQLLLGDRETIEFVLENRCFLPIIRDEADIYLNSPQFIEKDVLTLTYEEPLDSNGDFAPYDIKLFYFIKIMEVYLATFFDKKIDAGSNTYIPQFPIFGWIPKLKNIKTKNSDNLCEQAINKIESMYDRDKYFTGIEKSYEEKMCQILDKRTEALTKV